MQKLFKILLWIAAAFFLFETFLHAFGFPLLEHDRIYLVTHDGYIALFALSYAVLLILISTDVKKYQTLFILTMLGIFLAFLNATWIAFSGGYASLFPVLFLDKNLQMMGIFAWLWYFLAWGVFLKLKKVY